MQSTLDEAWTIARLAAPIAVAQFLVTSLGLVDVAVLGHASPVDLAGASIGRSINFVGIALGIGASIALEPLASQAVGAKEPREAWCAFLASLVACTILWVPCAILAIASTWLLVPLGIEADLVAPARSFLVPQLPGMLLFTLFLAAKTYLQAHKRTLPSLVAATSANIVNFVVCNLLVRGDEALTAVGLEPRGLPQLGAFGAGLASSVASLVLAAVVFVPAWKMRPPDAPRGLRHLPVAKVLRLGTPVGLQLLAEIGVFSVVSVVAGRLGRTAVSAHQIAIGLSSFTFMGALGISGATAVRVGHAIGERRPPRMPGLIGIGFGALFMGVCALVFLTMPSFLVRLFTDDPETVSLGVSLLGIAAAFQLFDGVQGVAAGALRGAGDVRFAFVANVGAHWLVGFPLAIYLAFFLHRGTTGLWIGLLVGLFIVASLLLYRFVTIAKKPLERV